ncbi:Gfo/Idh/MocA family protein [Vallicoccus soli]|uniref:Gfo/Idh/MocA family oxidoreductase n=1 Tax=Vallicoccus soli TaxID=2339232 RepID=A0A3A3Z163_9ACTN|nr:Gfo/Idh/MocA family oxidoreductase [Vallicoccus soli]RJK97989.1 gfo/Idh/MocA family oxidoreductase [Vallicoccus soli]
MPTTEPLRIGVLGAARIAPRALVAPAHETGARLVAVAARDRSRAEAFAAEHGFERVVGSYEEVLADPEVELVYVPLANGLHGPWNLRAVRAGKHVLSEKPFASDAVEAEEVVAAARGAGVRVVEGFHYAHHPLVRRVLELVGSGEIGALRHVEAHVDIPAPADDDPRWSLELAGGAFMDLGCYALHVVRLLAAAAGGAPRVVAATARERDGHPGVDERLAVDLELPGGATALASCDMAAAGVRMSLRVEGTAGELSAPDFVLPHGDDRLVVRSAREERVERLGTRSTFTYQLEAVAAHVRDGAPIVTDADDAVAQARLVDACYAAAGLPPRPRTAL